MRVSLDLETECTVQGCEYYGKSLCKNDHSLSPWHSRITVISISDSDGNSRVFTSADPVSECRSYCGVRYTMYDGHNFKFDWLFLAVHGWMIPLDQWVGDSSIAAYVLTEKIPDQWLSEYEEKRKSLGDHHRKAGKHSLKTLAPYFLGVEPFWEKEDHSDTEYALKDAEYTRRLNLYLENRLEALGQLSFYKKLLSWTKMILQAEYRGLIYDKELASQLMCVKEREESALKLKLQTIWKPWEDLKFDLDCEEVVEKYLLRNYSHDVYLKRVDRALQKVERGINYGSPSQVSWLLKDCLKLDITGWDDEESTGAAVLTKLAENNEDVKIFHKWRKTNKLLTSFFPMYDELAPQGVIHPIYNVDVTRTGRTSSQRPNAQQVPSYLKPLFKARPGFKIVGYDAAAIEAKLIAYYTEDPILYEIIKTGVSIHDYNTIKWFKLDCESKDVKEKYPKERKATKNVGFALFYNAGFNRIRIALGQAGFNITDQEARQIHKQFKQDFKVSHREAQKVVNRFQKGETVINLLGRPLIIENPQDAYMKGFNKLIQSSASDYLLHSSLKADQSMKAVGIEAHPLLFVHDYVGFEVKESQAKTASKLIYESLTQYNLMTVNGPIILEAEGGISDCWE